MATISFLVNGKSTDNRKPAAWVTITENGGGSLDFMVKQVGGSMGGLRGVYFNIEDDSIVNALQVTAVTQLNRVNAKAMTSLRNGTDLELMNAEAIQDCEDDNHLTGSKGSANEGGSYGFTLSSRIRALTLNDFCHIHLDYSVGCNNTANIADDDNSSRWLYLNLF
ncbi:hypothetical protein [Nitrosomonas sp.]|uniref:hypothetical protein n=1 Tax=Nitrosomonas sp. TaxID=42353 RepID=UPI001DA537F6|nr:hypothetical protein [Nitrosomonas sp.]MBX3616342.1 hypothetical protein [Nitrosomonas sp.]